MKVIGENIKIYSLSECSLEEAIESKFPFGLSGSMTFLLEDTTKYIKNLVEKNADFASELNKLYSLAEEDIKDAEHFEDVKEKDLQFRISSRDFAARVQKAHRKYIAGGEKREDLERYAKEVNIIAKLPEEFQFDRWDAYSLCNLQEDGWVYGPNYVKGTSYASNLVKLGLADRLELPKGVYFLRLTKDGVKIKSKLLKALEKKEAKKKKEAEKKKKKTAK